MRCSLDARLFPLHGLRLIEASAGTGKTYTIANLFLRLLLGHGPKDNHGNITAHSQTLGVDQILVVTFTEAATGELRERIRARIHHSRLDFIAGTSKDSFIKKLLNDLDRHDERIQLLQAAERQMDEAAIFTIHGFCQRMLKQHAFESGTLFSSELLTDESQILNTCATDFWRRTFYPMSKPLTALAKSLWPTPEKLLSDIRPWLNKSDLIIRSSMLPNNIDDFQRYYIDTMLAIKSLWLKDNRKIRKQITSCGLKTTSKSLTRLDEMEEFIKSDALIPALGNDKKDGWEIYGTALLQARLKKGSILPNHSIFKSIDKLLENPLSIKKAFRGLILREALKSIKTQLKQIKTTRHQLSFDDLLTNLSSALISSHGNALAKAIRLQFRVAMIDEFQDTDAQQYEIFSNIYANQPENTTGLFMIGDPKQAIYAFRGADIFTYMKARNQVNTHYTLSTNWRSSAPMVAVVNNIFSQCSSPFIYDNDIPFDPIEVSELGKKKIMTINDQPLPAGQLWLQDVNDKLTVGSGDYQTTMSQATATEINRLLSLADQQKCQINDGDNCRSLQASDITILVRTSRQGLLLRNSLSQQGIASIYLSNNDSVFSCQEATDIHRLLSACITPTDERALRSALASPLFSLDAAYLDKLNHDEKLWEQVVEEFTNYQYIWFEQGILPMLRRVIFQREIAETLLTSEYGERQLTDILHLGELLASQSLELDSHHALYRWLTEAIDHPNSNASEQQLHLESESDLVKIVTIHKSKGLEYNVVFIPFICSWRKGTEPIFHDEIEQRTVLDLEGHQQYKDLAEKERLAEDLRLLYVALTRSVHRCYLGIAPYKTRSSKNNETDLHHTAIGWLLNDGKPIKTSELGTLLEKLILGKSAFSISAPPKYTLPPYKAPLKEDQKLKSLTFSAQIEMDWRVTSYSELSRNAAQHSYNRPPSAKIDALDASMETAGHDLEVSHDPLQVTIEDLTDADQHSIFHFPKGASPGTFLHTLFERVDFEINCNIKLDTFVREQLLLHGYPEYWSECLCQMLTACLYTPLDGDSLCLGNIPEHKRKVEMEFFLPIYQLKDSQLNTLITHHDPLSRKAGLLNFHQVQGMLKGFIDLIFEYNGQWYVLDYKSNWLGFHTEDYSRSKMEQSMIDHRYDLQYQLYSLALHRLLKQRIPNYDYEQHFGGVFYLFLRGITSDNPERHGIFEHRPHKKLIEQLDKMFSGYTNILPTSVTITQGE